jgi:hypothetical protein
MRTRVLRALILATMVLIVVSAGVWILGYLSPFSVGYAQGRRGIWFDSSEGDFQMGLSTGVPRSFSGWTIQTNSVGPQPWVSRLSLSDIFHFNFDYWTLYAAGPSPSEEYRLTVPAWSVVFCLILGLLFLMWRRKTFRWEVREDIRWVDLRLRLKMVRFGLFSGLGVIAGLVVGTILSAWARDVRPDTAISCLILLPGITLIIVYTRRRIPWRSALLWMALETFGCACFFEATLEMVCLNSIAFRNGDPDFLITVLTLAGLSFVCGTILLYFLQRKPLPAKPGPYCPQCAYCLVGTPRMVCPECGRGFTLEELGISAEELLPPGVGGKSASAVVG